MRFHLLLVACCCFLPAQVFGQVLDLQTQLDRQTFWNNQDWEWYRRNIPFFECPDEDITTTWYYRWELMTRHLTYGSPDSGYSFTEFIDRPFWSGAYGAISCPAGHQLYEARWLRSPVIANDYTRYWFRTRNAQPRNYSTWLADSAWAVHLVHPDEPFLTDLLPDLVENYRAWEARQYVPEVGLFWQTGHDDGMEFNINSRQTADILRGAPGFRPSFNAYMYADALAIHRIAMLKDEQSIATEYQQKAESLKQNVLNKLWDPRRGFFLQMYRDDEERDGHRIQKLTRTYETGQFAGSDHGRELIGYVPWQFQMVPPQPQYESAWKFLMDSAYFYAEYGPTTVERHDPMFLLKNSCCWWSGQSWPYATTQTLKAMANVIQQASSENRLNQLPVNANDYARLLHVYARSHRKNGQPYLAEALHPDTGSFEGHDAYNHSEHYFHSGFCDLVITGLVGLQPSSDQTLRIVPLAPAEWDWFALDRLNYHGTELCVVWDRLGNRYGRGPGFQVFADGQQIGHSSTLAPLTINLPVSKPVTSAVSSNPVAVNFAVNNDGHYFPAITAGSTAKGTSPSKVVNGNYWYDRDPPDRWVSESASDEAQRLVLDLGTPRQLHSLKLYFLDDGDEVVAPATCTLRYRTNSTDPWADLHFSNQPAQITGRRPMTWTFKPIEIRQIEIQLKSKGNARTGLTEIEAWGDAVRPIAPAPAPEGNLAFRPATSTSPFPKVTASHTSRFDSIEMVNDGRIIFSTSPHNRWTSYESPRDSDWLQIAFEKPEQVSRINALIYDDRGGVQPPASMSVEWWTGGEWKRVENLKTTPEVPQGGTSNELRFQSVTTQKIRLILNHKTPARSGLTEIEVWKD